MGNTARIVNIGRSLKRNGLGNDQDGSKSTAKEQVQLQEEKENRDSQSFLYPRERAQRMATPSTRALDSPCTAFSSSRFLHPILVTTQLENLGGLTIETQMSAQSLFVVAQSGVVATANTYIEWRCCICKYIYGMGLKLSV